MFDHVSLKVKEAGRSLRFYKEALAPLGYKLTEEYEGGGGFGTESGTALWISQGQPHAPGVHVAFVSRDRRAVDSFHAAALKAGGRDNGAPGPRENYGPHYYAAFVLDPDGNNVEAVCNRPGAK